MNLVQIEYSCIMEGCRITINNERVSPYSEVAVLEKQSFLKAAEGMLVQLDSEIGAPYVVELTGMEFQYHFLQSCVTEDSYCEEIRFHRLEQKFGKESRYACLLQLAEKYQIETGQGNGIRLFRESETIPFPEGLYAHICSEADAEIAFYRSEKRAKDSCAKMTVICQEPYGAKTGREGIRLHVPPEDINLFWEYYMLYQDPIQKLDGIIKGLRYQKLSERDTVALDAYLTGTPAFHLGTVPEEMEAGESVTIAFESFPEGTYTLHADGKKLRLMYGNRLEAAAGGEGILEIIGPDGTDLRKVHVIEHCYISKIQLIPCFSYLKLYEKNRIDSYVFPEQAEDAGALIWEAEDSSIVHVQRDGSVTALREGKTRLHVRGKRAEATLEIEVKPELRELIFEKQSLRMYSGEERTVVCRMLPENAACEELQWNFDNERIASCIPCREPGKCRLIAKKEYTGKGNLRCASAVAQVSAVCNVEVVVDKRGGILRMLTRIVWLCSFLCHPLFPVVGGLCIWGMKKTKNPRIWKSFRFYLITVCIYVGFLLLLFLIGG